MTSTAKLLGFTTFLFAGVGSLIYQSYRSDKEEARADAFAAKLGFGVLALGAGTVWALRKELAKKYGAAWQSKSLAAGEGFAARHPVLAIAMPAIAASSALGLEK